MKKAKGENDLLPHFMDFKKSEAQVNHLLHILAIIQNLLCFLNHRDFQVPQELLSWRFKDQGGTVCFNELAQMILMQ